MPQYIPTFWSAAENAASDVMALIAATTVGSVGGWVQVDVADRRLELAGAASITFQSSRIAGGTSLRSSKAFTTDARSVASIVPSGLPFFTHLPLPSAGDRVVVGPFVPCRSRRRSRRRRRARGL